MDYEIYKDGTLVNTIVADESFVSAYCEKNGYTYKEREISEPEPMPEPEVSVWDELDAAYQKGVNSAYDQ